MSIGSFIVIKNTNEKNVPSNLSENSIYEFEYEYNAELSGIVINKYIGTSTKVRIPEKIDGKPVVSIDGAFKNSKITEITIPDSVTTIGGYAFSGASSLTSITIGNGVTTIDWCAFEGCRSLTSVTIPDGVWAIGPGAFKECSSLTSVTMPDSIKYIYDYAFSGCRSLTSITIPNGVWGDICNYTFEGCSSLISITILDSVSFIGGAAFDGCKSLTNIIIPDGVDYIGVGAFHGCNSITSETKEKILQINSKNAFNLTHDTKNYSVRLNEAIENYKGFNKGMREADKYDYGGGSVNWDAISGYLP